MDQSAAGQNKFASRKRTSNLEKQNMSEKQISYKGVTQ